MVSPEFYQKNKDLFERVNNAILESNFTPIENVYFDLTVLKDLRMGLMLSVAEREEDLRLLIGNLSKYNNRPTRHFVDAFPSFCYNETELEKMYFQPAHWDAMFNNAPDTEISQMFPQIIKSFFVQNERCSHFGSITITINTWPINCHSSDNFEIYKRLMRRYLSANADCQFICQDPKTIDKTFWPRQQFIFVDNIKELVKEDSGLMIPLLKDQVMLSNKIFAPYSIEDHVLDQWKQLDKDCLLKLKEFFAPTELVLQSVCIFKFIPCRIP